MVSLVSSRPTLDGIFRMLYTPKLFYSTQSGFLGDTQCAVFIQRMDGQIQIVGELRSFHATQRQLYLIDHSTKILRALFFGFGLFRDSPMIPRELFGSLFCTMRQASLEVQYVQCRW